MEETRMAAVVSGEGTEKKKRKSSRGFSNITPHRKLDGLS